jgi:hypothetical protein
MPDLSAFPTYISIPFLIVFAILLLISRFLDVSEKWAQWSERRTAKKKTEPAKPTSPAKTTTSFSATPGAGATPLATNRLLLYAFLGGIAIPVAYALILYPAAPVSAIRYNHMVTLLSAMVYAAIASFITLYLRRRIEVIGVSKIAAMATGFIVTSILAMPLNIITTLMAYHRLG